MTKISEKSPRSARPRAGKRYFKFGTLFDDLRVGDEATKNQAMTEIMAEKTKAVHETAKFYAKAFRFKGDLEDIEADFWYHLYKAIHRRYDPAISAPSSFFAVVLKNYMSSKLRAASLRSHTQINFSHAAFDDFPSPENTSECIDQRDFIRNVLFVLAFSQHRQSGFEFLRFRFAGASGSDIAQRMGIPSGTVKSNMKRLVDGIKSEMPPEYFEIFGSPKDPDPDEKAVMKEMKALFSGKTTEQLIAMIKADITKEGRLRAYAPDASEPTASLN
jgi:RNA polymerase sigma factor (sigma-70 family)